MRLYDKQEWKRVRRAILAEQPLCVMCHQLGTLRPATDVDHILPITQGGAWYDIDNLQPLCASHHSVKTLGDKGYAVRMGAGINGVPIDPQHHWNK